MAGKNGKNGVSGQEEDKAIPTPEAPKAEVTLAAEGQKPNPTPEGEVTFVSQQLFGQKTYDEQMKEEKHYAGLNRTDEISQLGGASKTEIDLAQMKVFSLDRVGDDLYAAIHRGDTTRVESLAGLNSSRRLTEAQIIVLLKAKREADDDMAKRIAADAHYAQELEDNKKNVDEDEAYNKKAYQQNHRTTTQPTQYEPTFENSGWDDAGNYHDRYGNTYDPEGNVTAADGTQMDVYGLVTHTDGTMESVYGDVIPADANEIQIKDENGVTQSTIKVEDVLVTPPTGSPALDADGQKQLLVNAYQLYLSSPKGGGYTPQEAQNRAAKASEQDLAAFKVEQDRLAAEGKSTDGPIAFNAPATTDNNNVSPSARAAQIMTEAGLKAPLSRPESQDRHEDVSLAAQYLQQIPGYNKWANEAGREYRQAYDAWEVQRDAAKAKGEKVPPPPTRKSLDKFWDTINPKQVAAIKEGYNKTVELEASLRQPAPTGDKNPAPEGEQPTGQQAGYDEFGGYYDEFGGYDDGLGNYYAADGGFYDNKGGYTWPDGAYEDRFKNKVDTEGNLYTSSGQFYKASDYPNADFKGLLKTNAWKETNPDPFASNIPPTQAFDSFIKGKVWDPNSLNKPDSDQPISLFATADGKLTATDTGILWDPLTTPFNVSFNNNKTTAPWLNNNLTANV